MTLFVEPGVIRRNPSSACRLYRYGEACINRGRILRQQIATKSEVSTAGIPKDSLSRPRYLHDARYSHSCLHTTLH